MEEQSLQRKTASSVKWNFVDRFGTQILYGVTGIILARILDPREFGLIGAILVFQAFASLMIDSGFMPALLQRKRPAFADYCSVFWFNVLSSIILYVALFFAAPLIALWFDDTQELIPLSRVTFLSFIINALSLVPNNRLLKKMNVRPVAMANTAGLIAGGIVGIVMAVYGYGAWALVFQTLSLGVVKGLVLWIADKWMPRMIFSWAILKSYFSFGGSMMLSSFLNTLFLNIYSFVIGNRVGMAPLGYYTQGDKWSKMGIMSLTQIFQTSFLPTLSEVQSDSERFNRLSRKINRFICYVSFPCLLGLTCMAAPVFHSLFGAKWDDAIPLFQLLLIRGVFYVMTQSCGIMIMAKGSSRLVVSTEVVRDVVALVALFASLPFVNLSWESHLLIGLELLIAGQILASIVAWIYTLRKCVGLMGVKSSVFIADMMPMLIATVASCLPVIWIGMASWNSWVILCVQGVVGVGCYLGLNFFISPSLQRQVLGRLFDRKRASTV